ncbi:flagellin [uncultured Lentibacter sp.]|uniref:flagellin N-terminal helical domain-containing protein n=1 Tax=uncultured Lentibacter sp. TaxID=1659309 RepID=UPI002615BBEA|nr:flagellin [uncultured Lentibacter sp.]
MNPRNTNTASINAQYNLSKVNKEMESAMQQLSSGKRINSAADDAAGLSIATRMESQVRGLQQAIQNAGDGQNMIATAEGAMDEITNMLQRMRELSLQAASDTMNTQDRKNLNNEITQLKTEIDRVVENTRFNDQTLLDGSQQGTTFQIGAKSGENLSFNIADMSTSSLGASSSALTGAGAVSATAQGTAAVENVVNLTFNGNDSYDFTLVFDNEAGTGATNEQLVISNASVSGYSAQDVADKINTAVAATSATGYTGRNLAGLVEASVSGTTVTLTNKSGTEIDITSFASDGAGTMTVNPVTNTTADSVTLENTTELTSLLNTGGTTATTSTSTLQLEEGHSYQFRVNDTLVKVDATAAGIAKATGGNIAGLLADVAADIDAAIENTSGAATAAVDTTGSVSGTSIQLRMSDTTGAAINVSGFQKVTSAAVSPGFVTVEQDISSSSPVTIENGEYFSSNTGASGGTVLDIDAAKTGRLQFSNQDLSYTFKLDIGGSQTYVVDGATKDFNAELSRVAEEISAAGGIDVTATNNGGVLEIVNNTGAALSFLGTTALASPGIDAVTEGDAFFLQATATDVNIGDDTGVISMVDGNIVSSNDGVQAEASRMSLSFSANDRYTISMDADGSGGGSSTESDATFTFDVVGGSLTAAMNTINSQNSTTGVTASIEGSELILTKADGTEFALHGFSSESGGQISAANAAGQGGSGTLENAGDGASVQVNASGAAVATEVELSFSPTADKYSFKISDGSSTATVRATDVAADAATTNGLGEPADILTEIQSALSAANMSHITASVTDDVITLSNALGGKVDISDFKSDGTGEMTVAPKVGQGVGKILNDDAFSSSYDSIASIDALSSSTATLAVEAVDRALENINSARSELGALSNRLDHTISNLGNVIVNTEASQSRIEDADFAQVTGELTKSQIMSQAATAMLAQANASKQGVLSLLQG